MGECWRYGPVARCQHRIAGAARAARELVSSVGKRLMRISLLAIFLAIAWALHGQATIDLSDLTSNEQDAGARLFGAHCAVCHGVDGSGGKGPNLRKQTYERANTDAALVRLIRDGSGGMPGNWALTPNELRSLGGFVLSLGGRPTVDVPGDEARGRGLYKKHGCSACHIIEGHGGSLGPELTRIGLSRGPAHLSASILDPGEDLDKGARVVRITARDNREVRGMLVNEDVFVVQVRDASNRYHSFDKAELQSFQKLEGQSLMPSYRGSLSDSELSDLVAYLASLRGAR